MLRGLTTVNFYAHDLAAARDWYTDLLGIEPYYVRDVDGAPAYIEFRLGDLQHELGFIDARFAPPHRSEAPGNTFTYWAVDDLDATLVRLAELGATTLQPPIEHSPGYVTASVVDPFGNVLGVMFNQHYLDTVAGLPAER